MIAASAGADVSNWDGEDQEKTEDPTVFDRAKERMKANRPTEDKKYRGLGVGYTKVEVK